MCRELDSILEEILQEHLKNPKEEMNGGDEDHEYDLVDILIKEKQYGDLEVPITWDNIKAVIMVCHIVCKIYLKDGNSMYRYVKNIDK
jgi:hypothetical protein